MKNQNNTRPTGRSRFKNRSAVVFSMAAAAATLVAGPADAQLARKPSYYQQQNQPQPAPTISAFIGTCSSKS